MRRLPPLNALKAFEAAGRHLSFTRAADELHVTPAAVSQQVRHLEDQLGVPLFRRLTRALMLTDAGQAALPMLTAGLDELQRGVDRISAEERGGVLTVSSAPSFAAKWLVHRMPRFQEKHPDIRIRMDATLELVDFNADSVDIAVRFGLGKYPGMRTDRLTHENISPFCAPELMEGPHALRDYNDLRDHTLIHVDWGSQDLAQPDWGMWLATAGADQVDATRGPVFTTEILAVAAAIDGHGVALVNEGIVGDDVAAGRLVKPFDLTIHTEFGFFVVCPEQTADLHKNAAFREWVLAESVNERRPEVLQAVP